MLRPVGLGGPGTWAGGLTPALGRPGTDVDNRSNSLPPLQFLFSLHLGGSCPPTWATLPFQTPGWMLCSVFSSARQSTPEDFSSWLGTRTSASRAFRLGFQSNRCPFLNGNCGRPKCQIQKAEPCVVAEGGEVGRVWEEPGLFLTHLPRPCQTLLNTPNSAQPSSHTNSQALSGRWGGLRAFPTASHGG